MVAVVIVEGTKEEAEGRRKGRWLVNEWVDE